MIYLILRWRSDIAPVVHGAYTYKVQAQAAWLKAAETHRAWEQRWEEWSPGASVPTKTRERHAKRDATIDPRTA